MEHFCNTGTDQDQQQGEANKSGLKSLIKSCICGVSYLKLKVTKIGFSGLLGWYSSNDVNTAVVMKLQSVQFGTHFDYTMWVSFIMSKIFDICKMLLITTKQ